MTVVFGFDGVAETVTVARLQDGCITRIRCYRSPRIMRDRRSIYYSLRK